MNRPLKLAFILITVTLLSIVYRTSQPHSPRCICQTDQTEVDLVYIGETRDSLDIIMDNKTAVIAFMKILSKLHYSCENYMSLGKILDGGWNMCLAGPYMPQKPCLVYSFGVSLGLQKDFSFEDAVSSTLGCKVRSFDPSIKTETHQRSDNVWFYNIGIGLSNEVNEKGWKLKTLQTLVSEFKESEVMIDYLKINIEENEWTLLVPMLSDGTLVKVKQLGIEVHMADSDTVSLYRKYLLLKRLEDLGFRRWFFAPNYNCMKQTENGLRNNCYKMIYINVNYLENSHWSSP